MKLLQFFQESDGSYSATRLAFLATLGVTLGLGTYSSIVHHQMVSLDPSWVALCATTMAGKVFQYGKEPEVKP